VPNRVAVLVRFLGGALNCGYSGKTVEKIGNQTDIAATILNQLEVPHTEFTWSRDLLNSSSPEFSFFSWDNGFGFAGKNQVISFDNVGKSIIYRKKNEDAQDEQLLKYGKAYMQKVFQSYLDY